MRFLLIHNAYGVRSGEEVQEDAILRLLRARGHEVDTFHRSSAEIDNMVFGRSRAFFTGICNPAARRQIRDLVKSSRYDGALIQNLFPFISPAILPVLAGARVPVIMRLSNYRPICPNGLMFSHGRICERCVRGKEHWCVLRNCESSVPKSVGYALRSSVARRFGWFKNNVDAYISATHFLKSKFAAAGFAPHRIHVIPNVVADSGFCPAWTEGDYVAYAGRISHEKGVGILLQAAKLCPDIPFRVAGSLRPGFTLPSPLPDNFTLVGNLGADDLARFYRASRLVVSPSECYETFSITVAEAQLHERPAVVPDHGAYSEFVGNGTSGMTFVPGDSRDLATKIRILWESPELCRQMGQAGRKAVLERSSEEAFYNAFMQMHSQIRLRE